MLKWPRYLRRHQLCNFGGLFFAQVSTLTADSHFSATHTWVHFSCEQLITGNLSVRHLRVRCIVQWDISRRLPPNLRSRLPVAMWNTDQPFLAQKKKRQTPSSLDASEQSNKSVILPVLEDRVRMIISKSSGTDDLQVKDKCDLTTHKYLSCTSVSWGEAKSDQETSRTFEKALRTYTPSSVSSILLQVAWNTHKRASASPSVAADFYRFSPFVGVRKEE